MLELEEALARILDSLPDPTVDRVPLNTAAGRVLAETIVSSVDLPAFDNSSVDGFAVRAEETSAASHPHPVRLHLAGRVAAGQHFNGEIAPGQCIRIFTGSPMPRGSNAVVMQEDTRVEVNKPGDILVLEPVKPWENVRFQGEDVKQGATLAGPGEQLTIGRIALLAAGGIAEVPTARQPRVGLLATGSELREAGADLAPGQIYESNRAALAPLVRSAGGLPEIFPIVPDDLPATCAALEEAFAGSDVVLTCGGVSVGEMDFVKGAFEQLGGRLEFWKVAIKPGRPFVFGRHADKFLFGLPGNPVSALVTFLLLARPALLRWQGAANTGLPAHPGTLAEPLSNPGSRRHFMRVAVNPAGEVRAAGIQASHILSSMAAANGLVEVPPQTNWTAGTTVTVFRW